MSVAGEYPPGSRVKVRDGYDEWAATARAVVKKKSYRIRLGLASRKLPAQKAGGTGTDARSPK